MGWMINARPRPLYPRERPGTHCIGGWVGPRAGLDDCGKSRSPPGFDPRTVQPVASRYTDWAIPALSLCCRRLTAVWWPTERLRTSSRAVKFLCSRQHSPCTDWAIPTAMTTQKLPVFDSFGTAKDPETRHFILPVDSVTLVSDRDCPECCEETVGLTWPDCGEI